LEVLSRIKESNEKVLAIVYYKNILYCGLENGYMYVNNGQVTKKIKSSSTGL